MNSSELNIPIQPLSSYLINQPTDSFVLWSGTSAPSTSNENDSQTISSAPRDDCIENCCELCCCCQLCSELPFCFELSCDVFQYCCILAACAANWKYFKIKTDVLLFRVTFIIILVWLLMDDVYYLKNSKNKK
jgi:hypothetical protein